MLSCWVKKSQPFADLTHRCWRKCCTDWNLASCPEENKNALLLFFDLLVKLAMLQMRFMLPLLGLMVSINTRCKRSRTLSGGRPSFLLCLPPSTTALSWWRWSTSSKGGQEQFARIWVFWYPVRAYSVVGLKERVAAPLSGAAGVHVHDGFFPVAAQACTLRQCCAHVLTADSSLVNVACRCYSEISKAAVHKLPFWPSLQGEWGRVDDWKCDAWWLIIQKRCGTNFQIAFGGLDLVIASAGCVNHPPITSSLAQFQDLGTGMSEVIVNALQEKKWSLK